MSGVFGGGQRPAPPPPPPPPAARPERTEEGTARRGRMDEMARRRGAGAQVLAGETTGTPATGAKRLLGE
jgi:hypothetical protein